MSFLTSLFMSWLNWDRFKQYTVALLLGISGMVFAVISLLVILGRLMKYLIYDDGELVSGMVKSHGLTASSTNSYVPPFDAQLPRQAIAITVNEPSVSDQGQIQPQPPATFPQKVYRVLRANIFKHTFDAFDGIFLVSLTLNVMMSGLWMSNYHQLFHAPTTPHGPVVNLVWALGEMNLPLVVTARILIARKLYKMQFPIIQGRSRNRVLGRPSLQERVLRRWLSIGAPVIIATSFTVFVLATAGSAANAVAYRSLNVTEMVNAHHCVYALLCDFQLFISIMRWHKHPHDALAWSIIKLSLIGLCLSVQLFNHILYPVLMVLMFHHLTPRPLYVIFDFSSYFYMYDILVTCLFVQPTLKVLAERRRNDGVLGGYGGGYDWSDPVRALWALNGRQSSVVKGRPRMVSRAGAPIPGSETASAVGSGSGTGRRRSKSA